MRVADADNDLVKIAGVVERAGGEVIVLKGRVLNCGGQPVSGARVEIWQCDVNGRYPPAAIAQVCPGTRPSRVSAMW